MVPTVEQREDQDQEVLESDLVGEAFEEIVEAISEIDDVKELCDYTYSALEGMLRRKSDRELLVALSESVGEIIGGLPFDAPPDALKQAVRAAARSCIGVLQTAREKRVPRPCSEPESRPDDIVAAPSDDAFYYLPAHL